MTEPHCGCCGHARSMHGADQGRCFDPRGESGRCKCPAYAPPFDSTRAPDGRPGVYVQVTTPIGQLPPEQPPRLGCARCGAELEPLGMVLHQCGLRGEPLADRDAKPSITPELVALLAQAAADPALRAEAVSALWRSWGIDPDTTAYVDWTSTPPPDPGTYWVRVPDLEAVLGDEAEPSAVMICREYDRTTGKHGNLVVHRFGYEEPLFFSTVTRLGWLWWPVPIAAPPAPPRGPR